MIILFKRFTTFTIIFILWNKRRIVMAAIPKTRCPSLIPESEFLVKKVMSWERVRREVGLRYL